MKKFISIFLCFILMLSLCACGGSSASEDATDKAPEGKLLVGFGRANISPANGSGAELIGYGGNGTPPTAMTGMLDPIYGTCIAITDSDGKTALIYTVDTLYTTLEEVNAVRDAITQKTGIPGNCVVISGTHTHSSVSYKKLATYMDLMSQAAVDALADRAPATVQTGSGEIKDLSFVRHYHLENGTIGGDNFNYSSPVVSHTTQPDTQLQMVRFVREGDKKDILLANWQVHAKVASGGDTDFGLANRSNLSADFIGHARMEIEKTADCLFAYFSGASGNLNPRSRIPSEINIAPMDVREYAKKFTEQFIPAMDTLTDVEAGKLNMTQEMFQVTPHIYGKYTRSSEMELTAIRIGSVGFATVPFEMFDTNGMQIKDASSCDTTFVLTNASCDEHEYIPSIEVFDYNTGSEVAYEIDSCAHEAGTAEKVAAELASMLNALAG